MTRRLRSLRAACGGALLALVMCAGPTYGTLATAQPHVVFHLNDPRITESSSLVVSTDHPGLVYTANDSGDGPFVYVLDRSGRLVGTTTLRGVDPIDVEAMSPGLAGSLIVADIGDNDAVRRSVQVYRIAQPATGNHTVTADKVDLTYADGPRDAESAVYDAATGRLFVVSKEIGAHVYESPPHVFSHSAAVLKPIAAAPSIATDATLLPGGRVAVVRTYLGATAYRFPSWKPVSSFGLPIQPQGESISGVPGSAVVWVGSEGDDSAVWSVPLPPAVAALVETSGVAGGAPSVTTRSPSAYAGASASPAGDVSTGPGTDGSSSGIVVWSTSAAVLVAVTGAVIALSRRRSRR